MQPAPIPVRVASSNLVARSNKPLAAGGFSFFLVDPARAQPNPQKIPQAGRRMMVFSEEAPRGPTKRRQVILKRHGR